MRHTVFFLVLFSLSSLVPKKNKTKQPTYTRSLVAAGESQFQASINGVKQSLFNFFLYFLYYCYYYFSFSQPPRCSTFFLLLYVSCAGALINIWRVISKGICAAHKVPNLKKMILNFWKTKKGSIGYRVRLISINRASNQSFLIPLFPKTKFILFLSNSQRRRKVRRKKNL